MSSNQGKKDNQPWFSGGRAGKALPGHGAIMGGKGPFQNRADFRRFPWNA